MPVSGAPIFSYHDFVDDPERPAPASKVYVLSQRQFAAHLDALDTPSLRAATLRELIAAPTPGSFVLTFDDGHISNHRVAFPMLAARGWSGCFFIIANRVGAPDALGWKELREMAAAGMEIGSHSLTHTFLHRATAADIRREFGESKRILEDGLGQAIEFAALPYGSGFPGLGALISELGYRGFCTSQPGLVSSHSDPFALPRIAVKQRTSADFIHKVALGHALTLATLRSTHVVKELGKQLVGVERWRRVRVALATAAGRLRE